MAKSKLDYLQIKHLTGTQAEIAEVIGIEAYRKLVGYFGGERIAVAKPSTLINFAVARNIAEENDYSEEVMSALELSKRNRKDNRRAEIARRLFPFDSLSCILDNYNQYKQQAESFKEL